MTSKQLKIIFGLIALGIVLGILILNLKTPVVSEEPEGGTEKTEENNGSHGGQLLVNGDFSLEVKLSEEGGEPHVQIYQYDKGKLLPPQSGSLLMAITRPNEQPELIDFEIKRDALVSKEAIEEPHVFDALITAKTRYGSMEFKFNKAEGKIELSDQQIKDNSIDIQTVGPAKIRATATLPGEIRFNEDKTSHVVPRVSGIVQDIQANSGQQVKKGQILAVIASTSLSEQRSELLSAQKRLELAKGSFEREKYLWQAKISAEQDYLQARQLLSEAEIALNNAQQKLRALGAKPTATGSPDELNRYEIRAPFDGMIVEKHIALGEAVKDDASIFTLTDLSSVWAEIVVSAKDLNVVRVGQTATIKATALDSTATGIVSYVGSLMGEQTRTAKARVTLANPDLAWRPGLFINVEMVSNETEVPISVSAEAVQLINNEPTVFVRIPGGFLAQLVETGRSDSHSVEILKGLKPGVSYAVNGSFVLKSEQGKAGASHEH